MTHLQGPFGVLKRPSQTTARGLRNEWIGADRSAANAKFLAAIDKFQTINANFFMNAGAAPENLMPSARKHPCAARPFDQASPPKQVASFSKGHWAEAFASATAVGERSFDRLCALV
jgi:hypothetical protein